MFEGVKTRLRFLLPIMTPEYVVGRILDAIRNNRRRVILPRVVYATWLVRLLPVPVFDAIMELLGINRSMDDFVGRAGHQDPRARVSDAG
jgi:all-trans-retinol dehydrogenase (NAD+)